MAKDDNSNTLLTLGFIAIVAILISNSDGGLQGIFGQSDNGLSKDNAGNEICLFDGATMTIGPVEKKFSPGTAITGMWHRLYIGNIDDGLKADQATKAVSFDDEIAIYYAENASNFYAAEHKFNIPCKKTFTTASLAKSDEYKVIANSTITLQIFNDDDSLKNVVNSQPDATSLGSTVTPRVRVKFGPDGGVSPKGRIIFAVVYNNTAFDSGDVELSHSSGLSDFKKMTSIPSIVSKERSAAGFDIITYSAEGVEGKSTSSAELILTQVIDSTNKYDNGTSIYVYDEDWYRDSEDKVMKFGTENDNGVDVGSTAEDSVQYYGS